MNERRTRLRSKVRLSAIVALACLALSACGGGSSGSADTSGKKQVKLGLALAGPRNDHAFYQSYFDGATELAGKFKLKLSVVDNLADPQQITDALKNLATDNDVVIGGGSALVGAANAVAPQFRDTTFIMSGIVKEGIPNLSGYMLRQGVPAYVMGVVAAKLTKTKTVGFIGGAKVPPTTESDIDFKAGIQSVDQGIKYSTITVGTFSDAAKAKEAAAAEIANGADVIYAFVNAGLPGVLQAVEESGKDVRIFNPTSDRCAESKRIIGYDFMNSAQLVATMYDDYANKRLPKSTKFYAIDDPKIQKVIMCSSTADMQAKADEVTASINKGGIKMPEGG